MTGELRVREEPRDVRVAEAAACVSGRFVPRCLVGEQYRISADGRQVLVVDHELTKAGRTGRLVVALAGERGEVPWVVWPEELEAL